MVTFKFNNWDKYNKRQKDIKRPFWFALNNEFFLDPDLVDFTTEERLTLIYLLCEASRTNLFGEVTINEVMYSRFTTFPKQTLFTTIDKLLKLGAAAGLRRDAGKNATATLQNKTEQDITEQNTLVLPTQPAFDFEKIYDEYPKRQGNQNKKTGMVRLEKLVKEWGLYHKAMIAVRNYKKHCDASGNTGTAYVKQFGNFFDPKGNWQEWVEFSPTIGLAPSQRNKATQRESQNRAAAAEYMAEISQEEEV